MSATAPLSLPVRPLIRAAALNDRSVTVGLRGRELVAADAASHAEVAAVPIWAIAGAALTPVSATEVNVSVLTANGVGVLRVARRDGARLMAVLRHPAAQPPIVRPRHRSA